MSTAPARRAPATQGSAVPITNANKPGNAILTLGTSAAEPGFTYKTNGSGAAFRVRGGVWSNSNIVRSNNGNLESTESIRANTGLLAGLGHEGSRRQLFGIARSPDPGYASDLDVAGTGIPDLQTVPASCSGTVNLQPGYYDDVTRLNALTPNGGSNCLVHLNPGTYYFDFHNNSADPLFDPDIAGSSGDVWNINSGSVIGGQLTSDCHRPRSLHQPDRRRQRAGRADHLRRRQPDRRSTRVRPLELCASYRANRPPIAVYGQKTGTATQTVVLPANALTPNAVPSVTPSTFTGATTANLKAADGNQATNANLAVWARDATGVNSAQPGSITMDGFAPSTPLPKGTVLAGARLKITHRSDGNQNAITFTPNGGSAFSSYTLPARTTLGTEDVDLTARTGWAALQKSVHDNGFTGATLKFDASLARSKTSQLDAARLELTYYLPTLRGETTASIPSNTVASPGGEAVVKALGNSTLAYVQGTTYVPLASLDLSLNNIAESVFRFGVDRAIDQRLRDRVVQPIRARSSSSRTTRPASGSTARWPGSRSTSVPDRPRAAQRRASSR